MFAMKLEIVSVVVTCYKLQSNSLGSEVRFSTTGCKLNFGKQVTNELISDESLELALILQSFLRNLVLYQLISQQQE